MQSTDIKQAAHDMIDHIKHLTWAELAYQAALKASIEQGLEEANKTDNSSPKMALTNEAGL
ncbi:MAG: hypothetical protein ACI845_000846 [Gammaproteobacteria bacterium]|jgi:toxin ParE1/3/4